MIIHFKNNKFFCILNLARIKNLLISHHTPSNIKNFIIIMVRSISGHYPFVEEDRKILRITNVNPQKSTYIYSCNTICSVFWLTIVNTMLVPIIVFII